MISRPIDFRPNKTHSLPDMTVKSRSISIRYEELGKLTYLTYMISNPSLTSCGKSLVLFQISNIIGKLGEITTYSFRFCVGRSTVFTPARKAPMSFSLIPPTAVTRPRSDISPCEQSVNLRHAKTMKQIIR